MKGNLTAEDLDVQDVLNELEAEGNLKVAAPEEEQGITKEEFLERLVQEKGEQYRSIAEHAIKYSNNPVARQERSQAEIAKGLPGRVIFRSIDEQVRFLKSKLYPRFGKRERERHERQAARKAAKAA